MTGASSQSCRRSRAWPVAIVVVLLLAAVNTPWAFTGGHPLNSISFGFEIGVAFMLAGNWLWWPR